MTQFTKEQLIERARTRLEHMQEATRDHSGSPDACMDLRLAEMAYAAVTAGMEQDPVAWQWFHLNQWHVTNDEERARDLAWDGVKVEPLYAAPQLPQPAVAASADLLHIAASAIEDLLTSKSRDGEAVWYDVPAQLRRAAMLQGAEPVMPSASDEHVRREYRVEGSTWIQCSKDAYDRRKAAGYEVRELYERPQNAQQNIPENIPDGWVSVPVEMMPEQMRAVQVNSELGAYAAANLTGAYDLFREFWDVAIKAVPESEV